MKRSDMAMIILIAAGSMLVAYFVANAILGGSSNQTTTVKTINAINSTIQQPDPTIFNGNAINPTYDVTVDSNTNSSTQ